MRNCYHYDMSESGTCETCGAEVSVLPSTEVTVEVGKARATFEVPGPKPTLVAAIATALGVAPSAITLVDASVKANHWEGFTAFIRLGGKTPLVADVRLDATTTRTPKRVEYEPVVLAVSATDITGD